MPDPSAQNRNRHRVNVASRRFTLRIGFWLRARALEPVGVYCGCQDAKLAILVQACVGGEDVYLKSLETILDQERAALAAGGSEQECTFWFRPDRNICIQRFCPSAPMSYSPHTHSEYIVVVCLAGAVSKTQAGSTHVLEPGEALIDNCGVEHASEYLMDNRGCESVGLAVDRRILADLLDVAGLPSLSGSRIPAFLGKLHSRALHACAVDISLELQHRALGHSIVLEGLAMRMLVETLRAWPRASIEPREVDLTPRLPHHDFVRACEFMRWCRKDGFRLKHLCRFLGSSEERFTRLFRATTNDSPAQFYNRLLLEQAREMIEDRLLSVKEISYQLGFKTSSHFVVAFRKQYGRTPLQHRISREPGTRLLFRSRTTPL